ncbi:uncharacterized protein BKA55DRAFT_688321 [Fusarium redolens]|uniref:Uncharacterized protein n=1 Tax=Fusarium redolens TaxID=48865 RepID=A0A9P9HD77_FUSRE|nr:uncharacterized protein BKA55DRAFT_688321 [Fusarium redolens]KAH7255305.1 hypothetical protein BKA55DRAFT_688321 [Fusarium redolens]
MCREVITIAQCAPEVAPVLAFYCAKLHLVAKERVVCDAARGKCICFFGSCGIIDREIPTKGIDLAGVTKVRCAECTPRESRVGNGFKAQEILESVLLRPADAEHGWEQRFKVISELWLNKTACPYHVDVSAKPAAPITEVVTTSQHVHFDADAGQSAVKLAAEPAGSTEPACEPVREPAFEPTPESAELKPGFEAAVEEHFSEFSGSERPTLNATVSPPSGPIFTDSLVAEPASPADEWTTNTAPAGEQGDNANNHGFESGVKEPLDPDEVGISTSRWAPGNANSNSSEPAEPADEVKDKEQGQEQGQEQEQAPVVAGPRRAVNFSYDPNNAEKLLETAEKFANVKAFLMAKA